MGALLLGVLDIFGAGLIQQMLLGAGLGLVTSSVALTVLNSYISSFQSQAGALGAVASFAGLSGIDTALSIVIGALVARATINSMKVSLSAISAAK